MVTIPVPVAPSSFAEHVRQREHIARLRSPQALAKLKSAQTPVQREVETMGDDGLSSLDIKQILAAFTVRIVEFAHTPEGEEAANHALDWECEQDWKHIKHEQKQKQKPQMLLWDDEVEA